MIESGRSGEMSRKRARSVVADRPLEHPSDAGRSLGDRRRVFQRVSLSKMLRDTVNGEMRWRVSWRLRRPYLELLKRRNKFVLRRVFAGSRRDFKKVMFLYVWPGMDGSQARQEVFNFPPEAGS